MIAPHIMAFALLFPASLATLSTAHALPRGTERFDRVPRLSIIPSGIDGQSSMRRSMDCGFRRVVGTVGPGGFVRGPGGFNRSADAGVDIGESRGSVAPGTRSFLRIIPRFTFF